MTEMMLSRRGVLRGLIAAPLIVAVGRVMPISAPNWTGSDHWVGWFSGWDSPNDIEKIAYLDGQWWKQGAGGLWSIDAKLSPTPSGYK